MFNFADKNVLVTGGTRGIGRAITEAFLRCGAKVLATGSTQNSVNALLDSLPPDNLETMVVDFKLNHALSDFADQLKSRSIDILINNAGINKIDVSHNVSLGDWDTINQVNLRTPFVLSQACVPYMLKKQWGRIVNIGSIFGVVSKERRVSYSCTKHGINGLTQAMALDYANQNIMINTVSPGFIDTELTRSVLTTKQIEELVSQVAMKRLGKPEEIATTVLFYASDLNTFTTGQNIVVDGGFTIA